MAHRLTRGPGCRVGGSTAVPERSAGRHSSAGARKECRSALRSGTAVVGPRMFVLALIGCLSPTLVGCTHINRPLNELDVPLGERRANRTRATTRPVVAEDPADAGAHAGAG